jgi:hypothetical protein
MSPQRIEQSVGATKALFWLCDAIETEYVRALAGETPCTKCSLRSSAHCSTTSTSFLLPDVDFAEQAATGRAQRESGEEGEVSTGRRGRLFKRCRHSTRPDVGSHSGQDISARRPDDPSLSRIGAF